MLRRFCSFIVGFTVLCVILMLAIGVGATYGWLWGVAVAVGFWIFDAVDGDERVSCRLQPTRARKSANRQFRPS